MAIAVELAPDAMVAAWVAEAGPIEIASAVVLGAAFLIALPQLLAQPTWLRFCGTVVLLYLVGRELDLQTRFTYRSVESFGYYARPYAPLTERLIVFGIMLAFAIAGLVVVRAFFRRLQPALQRQERWLNGVFLGVSLVACSMLAEKFFDLHAIEEVLECGVAGVVLWLVAELRPVVRHPVPERAAAVRLSGSRLPWQKRPAMSFHDGDPMRS